MAAVQLPITRMRELIRDGAFLAAVEALYAALDARIAARRPRCWNRGDCCNFASYGHKLYVTPVELSYFIATVVRARRLTPLDGTSPGRTGSNGAAAVLSSSAVGADRPSAPAGLPADAVLLHVMSPAAETSESGRCPFQHAGRCAARDGRPSPCRIFFCDRTAQSWQPSESEDTLGRIKKLHARFDVAYAYVEWFDALAATHALWQGA